MTIFIRFAMAESVVDIDGNGSFQNQTEDVASSVTHLTNTAGDNLITHKVTTIIR